MLYKICQENLTFYSPWSFRTEPLSEHKFSGQVSSKDHENLMGGLSSCQPAKGAKEGGTVGWIFIKTFLKCIPLEKCLEAATALMLLLTNGQCTG